MNASIKGEVSRLIIWDVQLAIQGPECLANTLSKKSCHSSLSKVVNDMAVMSQEEFPAARCLYFSENVGKSKTRIMRHIWQQGWEGGHHVAIITDDVDKTQNLRKGSSCECSHQAYMNPYLFITFAPVRWCVDMASRCFISTVTDGRGGVEAVQHFGKKITEGTVFSKARKCAAKAGMPGHLADIIFKMEISSGGRRGQSVCFPATSQAQLSGTWIISSGRLWEYM